MRYSAHGESSSVMAEKFRSSEQMLELSEDEANSPEHLDSQVQKAQEQLLQLKRQQEQIEKQKRELEELSRRQEELEHGRAEMADKLTRSLVVLEREGYNAQSRLEQIRAARRFVAGRKKLHDRKRTCVRDSKNSSSLLRRCRKSRKTGRTKDQKIIEPINDSASRWRRTTSAKAGVPSVLVRCARSEETAKSFFCFFWWRLQESSSG